MSDIQKILIIEPRKAMQSRLAQETVAAGFDVIPAHGGRDGFTLASKLKPAMILLSDMIRDVKCKDIIKVFKSSPTTKDIPLILLTQSAMKKTINEYLQAGVNDSLSFTFHHAELQQTARAFGIPLADGTKHGGTEQLARTGKTEEDGSDTKAVAKQRSYSIRSRVCPFHQANNEFDVMMLRPNTHYIEPNEYDIPLYKNAVKNFEYVDYALQEVMVCPHCLFASTDPNVFIAKDDAAKTRSMYPPRLQEAVVNTTAQRKTIVDEDPMILKQGVRDLNRALRSLDLAIASSMMIYDLDPKTYPIELYRVANYNLKKAQLYHDDDQPEQERACLETAFEQLNKAYLAVTGAFFWRLNYQVISLGVRLDRDKEIGGYMSKWLELARNEAQIPEVERDAFHKFFAYAKKTWEDRDFLRSEGNLNN